jgi:DNA-binding CsgD family transcriptional regulator
MIKNNIPQEIKDIPRWICHKAKVPKNPKSGRNLAGDQTKWGTTFEQACEALKKHEFDGLGFVFTANDGYCGIDIDHCVENGKISEKAQKIIDSCNSYTEKSLSGSGIHIIVKNSDKKKILHKKGGVEAYSEGRYFTMSGFGITGNDKVNTINVNSLLQKISKNGDGQVENDNKPVGKELLSNSEIKELIERIEASANGAKFKILWDGNWAQEYESHSEADMALCNILAFWINDAVKIDQMFRLSKAFREKWDRSVGQGKTYGQLLIEKTLMHQEGAITANSLVVEIDTFKTMNMPEIKTIMSPWLTFGSTHMIYAKRGVGKTFFALSLSLSVTHGSGFGDWELQEAVNSLYVDGEMLPQDMKKRIANLQFNYTKKEKNWYILSSGINLQNGGLSINIAKPYWQDFIFNEVKDKDIKLLLLDNISALTPGIEENESTSWDNIAVWVNKLKQTGCAVILVHHAGKSGTQRGTSAREDMLDTVITLRKTSEDATVGIDVNIIFEKSRHIAGSAVAATNARLIPAEPGSDSLIWAFSSPGISKRNEVLQLFLDGKTADEIRDLLGTSKSAIAKYKRDAVSKGWIGESKGKLFLTNIGKMAMGNGDEENGYGF